MKLKLIVAAVVAALLGGCIVVPEGHGRRDHGWHDSGWRYHGHREGYHHRW